MQAERAVVRKQFSRRVCSWSQIPRVSLAPKPCEAQPSAEGAVKRHPPTGPSDDQQGLQEKPTDLLVGRFGHPAPPLRAQVLTSQRTPLQSRVLLAVSLNRPPPPFSRRILTTGPTWYSFGTSKPHTFNWRKTLCWPGHVLSGHGHSATSQEVWRLLARVAILLFNISVQGLGRSPGQLLQGLAYPTRCSAFKLAIQPTGLIGIQVIIQNTLQELRESRSTSF